MVSVLEITMSIKKGKKQVYKVGNCGCTKGIVRLTCRVHGLLDAPLRPKKSIKKMYKAKIVCGNCPKSQYVQIPFGTRVIEFIAGENLICKFCGC